MTPIPVPTSSSVASRRPVAQNGFQQALAHTLDQARQAAERFRGQGVDLWGYTTTQPGGVTRSEVLGRRYH